MLEIERNGGATMVIFGMSEEDVRLIMKQPFVATASDGSTMVPSADFRTRAATAAFRARSATTACAKRCCPLEHAIRSASGLPADILHLPQRGYLKPGYYADVVVFDPQTFRDVADLRQAAPVRDRRALPVRQRQAGGGTGQSNGVLAGKALRHTTAK